MKCLICGTEMEVITEDDGSLPLDIKPECSGCTGIYTFDKRNKLIDDVLCGMGCVINWNYNKKVVAPLPAK